MAGLPPEVLRAIDGPVRQVRRTLRELDNQELPAALRKVVATEGGRLPPPLLVKLLTELDGNEWLRGRLIEKLGDRIEPETEAFLGRPSGWWLTIATAVAEGARSRPPQPAGDEVAALGRQLVVAKKRIDKAERERDRLRNELRSVKAAQARLVGPHQSAADRAALAAENNRLNGELAAERLAREESEERVESLRRRSRSVEVPAIPSHPPPREVGLSDPVEVARRLDREIAALAAALPPPQTRVAGSEMPEGSAAPPVVRLPQGLRPDRPDAIDWLGREAEPVLLIVDGYNVTFMLDGAGFNEGPARRRLVTLLGRFGVRKPHRILVVFDSSLSKAEPHDEPSRINGIEVCFTTGEQADDRIVELAATARVMPVVVVTNDRELRERVEAVGALALWTDALVPHLG